ncbi:hypothetical protein [Paenibacillus massiliensis]|uniref:hypothetical protein n=1 Tax=Paenibacillus massiliensis TaxID=225917 RepID=UPI000471771D|nr:hypothetical protein [Paenibacillus massiliensis]
MKRLDLSARLTSMPQLHEAIGQLAAAWSSSSSCWLLGGSCSLLLQGVELDKSPNDIDVYADLGAAKQLHRHAPGVLLDEQQLSRNEAYLSLLSHYELGGLTLELVGGFEVSATNSLYRVEIEQVLYPVAPEIVIDNCSVRLMPLAHELLFNLLRGREDRYQSIAKTMNTEVDEHRALLELLLARNVWSDGHVDQLRRLLIWL